MNLKAIAKRELELKLELELVYQLRRDERRKEKKRRREKSSETRHQKPINVVKLPKLLTHILSAFAAA